jgi:hypothetical protein
MPLNEFVAQVVELQLRSYRAGRAVLMPSTPFAYPQVISRTFALFRVVNSSISAGHDHFWGGFD